MRSLFVLLVLMIFALAGLVEARAGDEHIIAEVNKAAEALDAAFERQDVEAVKQLMTPNHIAVTPYYPRPQNVDEQIASLPDLKYAQTIVGDVDVSLIGDDAALRTFQAKLEGTFKGVPIARHAFVTQLMAKQDGTWVERFYQVTALKFSDEKRTRCKYLIGTYLTENRPKGQSGGSFISRSLLSLGRGHLLLFTDSGEGGEAGFASFTDGRGSWYCRRGEDGTTRITGTTLDFTAPSAGEATGGIGRLDFDLTFNGERKTIGGTAMLYLLPLDGDPLNDATLKDAREFEITGQRVGAH